MESKPNKRRYIQTVASSNGALLVKAADGKVKRLGAAVASVLPLARFGRWAGVTVSQGTSKALIKTNRSNPYVRFAEGGAVVERKWPSEVPCYAPRVLKNALLALKRVVASPPKGGYHLAFCDRICTS